MQFGTDGIRGRADDEITESVAYRFGYAVAEVFNDDVCFVGSDPRESSPRLVAAAIAGLEAGGSTVVHLGVITTPGVAVVAERRGGVGLVVSASHNPYYDNGLKLFGVGGTKLDTPTESAVQAAFDRAPALDGPFGETPVNSSGVAEYVDQLSSVIEPDSLLGMRLVLDCANGAASELAGPLFRYFGAEVELIHATPDGTNINQDCGSTHPEELAARVRASHADLGMAFDGDGDRLIAVDGHGTIRDGDDMMILFARDLDVRGELGGTLVVTSMSNLGLRHAMRDAQIEVIETDIGDRWVQRALAENDLPFGGEQSGHLIFRRLWPTGDGLLSALLLADLVRRTGRLSELAEAAWTRSPQRLFSVPVDQYVADVVTTVLDELIVRHEIDNDDYRLLVRASGTEPLVRVMIEANDGAFVDEFVTSVQRRLGIEP